ncbi:MAG: response regulator [Proteobacteria bacterium]|nr:response regulator [Pseudomonadota bacterium]
MQQAVSLKRVLVVDDDAGQRATLAANLELDGFLVEAVADGHQALERARQQRFDVVVTDYRMPGLSGLETLQALKLEHPGMAVVLITAYATDDQLDQAILDGAFAVLRKPLSPEHLSGVLHRALSHPVVLALPGVRDCWDLAEGLARADVKTVVCETPEQARALGDAAHVDVCIVRTDEPSALLAANSLVAAHFGHATMIALMDEDTPRDLADAAAELPEVQVRAAGDVSNVLRLIAGARAAQIH